MDSIRDFFYPNFPRLFSYSGENQYNLMNIFRVVDKWSGLSYTASSILIVYSQVFTKVVVIIWSCGLYSVALEVRCIQGFGGTCCRKFQGRSYLYSQHGGSGFLSKVGIHLQVNTTSQHKTAQCEYVLKYYKHTEGTFVIQSSLDRDGPWNRSYITVLMYN